MRDNFNNVVYILKY